MKKYLVSFFLVFFLTSVVNPNEVFSTRVRFEKYLDEINSISRREISDAQRKKLMEFYDSKTKHKRRKAHLESAHRKFKALKEVLRKEWREKTGVKWPTYNPSGCSKERRGICKKQGWFYHMHHIFPQSHHGPHEWWNIYPLTEDQHNKVHGSGSIATGLFPASVGKRIGGY